MVKIIFRFPLILVLILVTTMGLSACSLLPAQKTNTVPADATPSVLQNNQQAEVPLPPILTEYNLTASVSGQTALELLKQSADVQVKEYEFGSFIEAINGVLGDENQYWAFYVNQVFANEAADKIVLKVGDTATFRLEKVESFPAQAGQE